MGHILTLSDLRQSPLLQQGLALRHSETFSSLPSATLPDGSLRLQAKCRDSFNFVDHALVVLGPDREAVSGFRCDCADFRERRSFCIHCAALLADRLPAVTATASTTAACAPSGKPTPELKELSYPFSNSLRDLYPLHYIRGELPVIPLERYIQAFGNTARARSFYELSGYWGGSCFGMVMTANLLTQPDTGLDPGDFKSNAASPSDLKITDRSGKLGMSLLHFIELVHILQYSDTVNEMRPSGNWDPTVIADLAQRVLDYQNGKNHPVGMAIFASPDFDGGHSIMPYRLEPVSSTEDKLHIYDPNYPLQTRYAWLTKDAQGNYTDWRYPMNDHETYSGSTGGQLGIDPFELCKKVWEARGSGAAANILQVSGKVSVLSDDGSVLARVSGQSLEILHEGIRRKVLTGGKAGKDSVLLTLPMAGCTLRQDDPEQGDLSLRLIGTDLSLAVTTDAKTVKLYVSDNEAMACVRIPETGCSYVIDMMNSLNGEPQTIQLVGATLEEELCFLQKDGCLHAQGLYNTAKLSINGQPVEPAQYIAEPLLEAEAQEMPIITNKNTHTTE